MEVIGEMGQGRHDGIGGKAAQRAERAGFHRVAKVGQQRNGGGIAARDAIREGRLAASASYPLAKWLLVSGSVQRVHYTKAYTPTGTSAAPRTDREWAGHLAATVALADEISVYGAWVTGLEESGTAPAIAVNANETLPALRATQREVGAKWRITPEATLLVSGFDITKGAPGRASLMKRTCASCAIKVEPARGMVTHAISNRVVSVMDAGYWQSSGTIEPSTISRFSESGSR